MINIIAAMTRSGVIGKGNALPWNIPEELKHFRTQTLDSTVIMGKRTFESIGRPLPKRHNIVLSTTQDVIENVVVCTSVQDAILQADKIGKNTFVIGGAYTYAQFIPIADRLYISYIKHDYEGDVYFPAINWDEWTITHRIDYPTFEFVLYERKS